MSRKAKLIIIGSFDPPTYAHLRVLERAKEFLEMERGVQVVEGIISILPDKFRTLTCYASSCHRMRMLKAALKDSRWIRADDWQCHHEQQSSIPQTLLHLDSVFNQDSKGNRVATIFLCTERFFEDINIDDSSVCTVDELQQILDLFDTIVVCSDNRSSIAMTCTAVPLNRRKKHLFIIHDAIHFQSDELCVRNALARGESIRFCTDQRVITYIEEHGLYSCQEQAFKSPPRSFKPKKTREKSRGSFTAVEAYQNGYVQDGERKSVPPCSSGVFFGNSTYASIPPSPSTSCYGSLDIFSPENKEHKVPPRPHKKQRHRTLGSVEKSASPSLSVAASSKNARASSIISFTFEEHNLLDTPETTV